jgi:predicted  nucleic acid-binding Zn-ribbon protein
MPAATTNSADCQITFKMRPEQLSLLAERANVQDISRHVLAKKIVAESLEHHDHQILAEVRALRDLIEAAESTVEPVLPHDLSERMAKLEQAQHALLGVLQQVADRLTALRGDISTGVCGLLVAAGKDAERARDWVERNLRSAK